MISDCGRRESVLLSEGVSVVYFAPETATSLLERLKRTQLALLNRRSELAHAYTDKQARLEAEAVWLEGVERARAWLVLARACCTCPVSGESLALATHFDKELTVIADQVQSTSSVMLLPV